MIRRHVENTLARFHPRRVPLLLAAACALLPSTLLRAQEAVVAQSTHVARDDESEVAQRTHLVRDGDTLWDLSRAYLNDPFMWPEIYRLNPEVVEDPHWIYPGELLRLPAGSAPATMAMIEERVQPLATVFDMQPRPTVTKPTLVRHVSGSGAPLRVRALGEHEFIAAPWVDRRGTPANSGLLLEAVAPSGIAVSQLPEFLQVFDHLYATLPPGSVGAEGERFLVVTDGPAITDSTALMYPTGIVEVQRRPDGEAATVSVLNLFGAMKVGQRLVPLPVLPLADEVLPTPVELGMMSSVLWVAANDLLPTVQDYLVLDSHGRNGVSLGDQFTLLQPRRTLLDGTNLPEEPLALGRVVRVTRHGITVMLIDQRHASIRIGTRARLTAKMP